MTIAWTLTSVAVSALLFVLAAPPFDLWPLAWVVFIPLYRVIRHATPLQAAGWAWLMGILGLLGACTWWLPLLRDFAHLSWSWRMLILLGLCGYQAIVYAIWAGICRWLNQRWQLSWLVSGPLVMVLAESLLPFLFKYYLGIILWRAWPVIQIAELGGPAAVSALLVFGNLILAKLLDAVLQKRRPSRELVIGLGVFACITVGGGLRALQIASARADAPTLQVGLVQPNFGIVSPQQRERYGKRYIKTLRDATVTLANQGAELIVWPESAWPYLFDREIAREYPPGHPWELKPGVQAHLLFGALTHTFGGHTVYNSAVLVSDSGQISGRYDKHRLVPFAEYIPFAEEFPETAINLRQQLPDWPDIVPGAAPQVLKNVDLRLGVLICSEDINVSLVNTLARQQPQLLVSLVSDAWFGASAAPHQHLALATLRAVETRRDFVRATNTGVSAVIDALGRLQLESTLVAVTPEQPPPAELLTAKVALLELFALGPYSIQFFPYICLGLLIAAIGMIALRSR